MERDTIKSCAIISVVLSQLLILLSPLPLYSAHTEGKSFLVGIIRPNANMQHIVDGFKSGMESYGYIEGKTIHYIQPEDISDLDALLEDMTAKNVDLIFTMTANVTKRTKVKMDKTGIPVIFGAVYDPVESGIVKSLSVPGSNITGVKIGGSTEKAFEWLLKTVPHIKRVFIPFSSDSDTVEMCKRVLKKSAEKSHVELVTSLTDTPDELTEALAAVPKNVDAIFIPNSPFLVLHLEPVIKFATKRKLPTGSGTGQYKNGVMITYGQDHYYSGKMASRLAKNVLHDKIPAASLPVETTEFFLGINLQSAKAIGLSIPDSVLQQADFIIR